MFSTFGELFDSVLFGLRAAEGFVLLKANSKQRISYEKIYGFI